jgi:hypothetical protein
MTESVVFNVLVAEDESFQRLALLDILTLCNYEGTNHQFLNPYSHCSGKWKESF